MQVQRLKISEKDRKIVSDFMGEKFKNVIDFNCLMEVIKKLDGGRNHIAMLWFDVTDALTSAKIKPTWKAVVAYIKWFYKKV